MKCCANDCNNEAEPEDFCCTKHTALIIEFRRAFDNVSVPLIAILNYGFAPQTNIVDIEYKSLSTDIIRLNETFG